MTKCKALTALAVKGLQGEDCHSRCGEKSRQNVASNFSVGDNVFELVTRGGGGSGRWLDATVFLSSGEVIHHATMQLSRSFGFCCRLESSSIEIRDGICADGAASWLTIIQSRLQTA